MTIQASIPDAVNSDNFLNNLRNETSGSHRKLESLPISEMLVRPDLSSENYFKYLSLMYGIVIDIESKIYPLLEKIVPDINQRLKSHLLEEDLNFGNYMQRYELKNSFYSNEVSTGFLVGIAYVLEGSTLGGRFILKNVGQVLNLNEKDGASYFFGSGNQTGLMWKTFLQNLTDFERQSQCASEIIDGAQFAFDAIYKHFAIHSQR